MMYRAKPDAHHPTVRPGRAGLVLLVLLCLSGCVQSETIDLDEDESPGSENTTAYIERVTSSWVGDDVPSEDELLELGESACDQLGDGEEPHDVEIIEGGGDAATANTQAIVEAAALSL